MLFPIVAIAGCTGAQKTRLALSLAKETNATVVPLDQLHRYKHMKEGTGLDVDGLSQVRNHGYQVLSPWEVSGPDRYVMWLRDALVQLASIGPVVIEGGCTSYLKRLVACSTDQVLGQVGIVALSAPVSETTRRDHIEMRVSNSKMAAVIAETATLEASGFLSEAGTKFLLECEQMWVHPESEDLRLAWAVRIAAKVYAPAYQALKGQISADAARARVIANVLEIQHHQSKRTLAFLPHRAVFEQADIPELYECIASTLLTVPASKVMPNLRLHPTALEGLFARRG